MNNKRYEFLKQHYVQGFPAHCGFEVECVVHGIFQTRLKILSEHKQQDGDIHAGIIATIADHTAGYSAYTVVPENIYILTIEFKINYFKPALGEEIKCISKVINNGKQIIVSESEIFSISKGQEKLISKAIVTLMAVPAANMT